MSNKAIIQTLEYKVTTIDDGKVIFESTGKVTSTVEHTFMGQNDIIDLSKKVAAYNKKQHDKVVLLKLSTISKQVLTTN